MWRKASKTEVNNRGKLMKNCIKCGSDAIKTEYHGKGSIRNITETIPVDISYENQVTHPYALAHREFLFYKCECGYCWISPCLND